MVQREGAAAPAHDTASFWGGDLSDRGAPLIALDRVAAFLEARGIASGPITCERIGGGHSNLTFLVRSGDVAVVLRRGPRPPHPPSAHDMVREARMQDALVRAGVPVPRVIAVSDDRDVVGVPFYIMEFIPGTVVTDVVPPWLEDTTSRRLFGEAVVDTLVDLHAVKLDVAPPKHADRYLARQIERFSDLWGHNSRRKVPMVEDLADWLRERLPRTQRVAVVHGDYRIGNLMFSTSGPRIRAVLDWEMSTFGDPLADVGYLLATYTQAEETPTIMELTPVTRLPGFAHRDDIAARYEQSTGLDLSELPWYQTFALWKSAIFCEAMYTRWLDGERPDDDFAPRLEAGVPQLLERALAHSQAR